MKVHGRCASRRCEAFATVAVAGIAVCPGHYRELRREFGPSAPDPVVYYAGDPVAKLVKIGTSADLRTRITDLRRRRPGLVLLATEPGGVVEERRRHAEFASLRETGEWFRRVPYLVAHVNDLRGRHGLIQPGGPLPQDLLA